jgi:hypothetical protein
MNLDDFKVGGEPPKKRHRRTKKEMEEARKKLEKTIEDSKEKYKANLDKVESKIETIRDNLGHMKTIDEVCEEQLQRAKDKGLPNPDFDYRQTYSKGQIIYYILTNELIGSKIMLELKISSVYPRAIIAFEDKGMGYTIGWEDADMIYLTHRDCEQAYKDIVVDNKLEEYFQRQKQLANKRRIEENNK